MEQQAEHTAWIDDARQLKAFCRGVAKGPLAVDTESDHFHAYQAQVCLIQLATPQREALVDPLALKAGELAPLLRIFEDSAVPKILHAARNDIIEIDRDYGVGIANLFDTQIAARFLDYERNSLNWMLESLLNVDTGGQYQRYDWTTRPLPQKVLQYAMDDVRHLLALRDRFRRELKKEQWFDAFCQQCEFVARSVEYEASDFDPDRWRKIKGSKKLDGRGRAALKALYLWRHKLCTELNRSAVTVFPNGVLKRLARVRPTTAEGVRKIKGLPAPLAREYSAAIAEAVQESLSAEIPPKEPPRRAYQPVPPEQKQRYNALRSWRNKMADKLAIPSEFIATNATLTQVAEEPPSTVADLERFSAILPWHRQQLGEAILEIVARD